MDTPMTFPNRAAFRDWLEEHGQTSGGVWLLLGKAGGPKTLKASEALEEALCFGWIDGQMQRIDDKCYRKYFSPRRENSKWSEKNKALVQSLEERGLMNPAGRRCRSPGTMVSGTPPRPRQSRRRRSPALPRCWKATSPLTPIFKPCPPPCRRLIPGPISTPKQRPDGSGGSLGWWTGSIKI